MNIKNISEICFEYYGMKDKQYITEFYNLEIDNLRDDYTDFDKFKCDKLCFYIEDNDLNNWILQPKALINLYKMTLKDKNKTYEIVVPFYDFPKANYELLNGPFELLEKIVPCFVEKDKNVYKIIFEKRKTIGVFFEIDDVILFNTSTLEEGHNDSKYIHYKDCIETVWSNNYSKRLGLLNDSVKMGQIIYDFLKDEYLVYCDSDIKNMAKILKVLKGTNYKVLPIEFYDEINIHQVVTDLEISFENFDHYKMDMKNFYNVIVGNIVKNEDSGSYSTDIISFTLKKSGLNHCDCNSFNHISIGKRLLMDNDFNNVKITYNTGEKYYLSIPFKTFVSHKQINLNLGLESFPNGDIRVTVFERNNICFFFLVNGKVKKVVPPSNFLYEKNNIVFCSDSFKINEVICEETNIVYTSYPKGRVEYDLIHHTFIIYADSRFKDLREITNKMVGQKYKIIIDN